MASIKQAFSSNNAMTVTNLHSLANSATSAWMSAAVDNTTDLYLDALVMVTVVNTSTAANDKAVYVYAYGSVDGSTYTDNVSGSEGTFTMRDPTALRLIGVIPCPDNAQTMESSPMSVAAAFGGILPPKWGIVVRNYSGAALSGSGNTVSWRGVYATSA